MRKSNSIKNRLVKYFMLIIIITVVILLVFLTRSIKLYYYSNVEDILTSEIEYSTKIYTRYFSSNVDDIVLDDVDLFWQFTKAQVQILNLDGEVLMDSIGVNTDYPIQTPDVVKAKNGEKGVWNGSVDYTNEEIMAVSMPLIGGEDYIPGSGTKEPQGIIRFISSLEETNSTIRTINLLLTSLGLGVVLLSGVVSVFLANSIVKPLIEVTEVAEKLADGQYQVRSKVDLDDEIGRLSNTLNHMADEILKREEIKNDFVSSISHELRTPLTSIKGWAITLKADEIRDDELLKDGLEIIEEESDRLSKMVNDLLDFSRFLSGRISLEKDIFSLRDTLNMVATQYRPRAEDRDIELTLEISDEINYITADENRIKQVLINLVDNAIKFTEDGGKIKLSSYIENSHLYIEVEDNGAGISAEDLPHIKDKFYRGKNKKANSGIGLSICDEIMTLHDGSLVIESEVGEGTIVKAILPYKEEVI